MWQTQNGSSQAVLVLVLVGISILLEPGTAWALEASVKLPGAKRHRIFLPVRNTVRMVGFLDSNTVLIGSASRIGNADALQVVNLSSRRVEGEIFAPRAFIFAGSSNGKLLAVAGPDNTVQIFNRDLQRQVTLKGHESDLCTLSFSNEDKNLLSISSDGVAIYWDLPQARLSAPFD